MSETSLIGVSGVVVVPTRGTVGVGEVVLSYRGGTETYLAWSDKPLAKGVEVLVVGVRGARTVDVQPLDELTS